MNEEILHHFEMNGIQRYDSMRPILSFLDHRYDLIRVVRDQLWRVMTKRY